MESIAILGCRVDAIDAPSAVEQILALAHGSRPSLVVTLGTEMVVAAQSHPRFREVVNGAALSLCDTIGLLLVSRLRGGPLRERVAGADLVPQLAARSATANTPLYLLGGKGDTAQRATAELRRRYPDALIAGARDGYFGEADVPHIVSAIRDSGAKIVLAALGTPKQELWLNDHLAATGCGVGIGVGGTFDVLAGNVRRAPQLVQRSGLEWLYRLISEPSRWRRQLALPRFALLALRESVVLRTIGRTPQG